MLSLDMSNANTQSASPLVSRLPGEIRDHIFELALTPYTNKQDPLPKDAKYYRPGFCYADQRLHCDLLRTCRRIYQETCSLPARIYVRVEWHSNGPPNWILPPEYHRDLRSLHLFTQQVWLEDWSREAQQISEEAPNLQNLRITLRHSDWWAWEAEALLVLDGKQAGTASEDKYSMASDAFDTDSWGYQFHFFKGLSKFELELETVEGKRKELDSIVFRAAEWHFPLGDGNALVLDPAKTKKTGWHGLKLRKRMFVSTSHRDADAGSS